MTLVYSFPREAGNPDAEGNIEMLLKYTNDCLQTEQFRKNRYVGM